VHVAIEDCFTTLAAIGDEMLPPSIEGRERTDRFQSDPGDCHSRGGSGTMGEVIASILADVLSEFFKFICFYTAKLVLPLVSLGRLKVLGYDPDDPRQLQEGSTQRQPDGTLGVRGGAVTLIGLIIWINAGVIIGIALYWT
jgi:hypothetical protein